MKKKLALFDFDGTITTKDSFIAFLVFSLGFGKLSLGLLILLPVILLYVLRIFSNEKTKEIVICFFYKNWSDERLKAAGKKFAESVLPTCINPKALERVLWHKEQGHTVCIVTASVNYRIEAWSGQYNLGLICTKLEIKDNRFTGNFLSHNCYGREKVRRIRAEIDLSAYDYIYAYGDSRGDREMLELADEGYYRKFQ